MHFDIVFSLSTIADASSTAWASFLWAHDESAPSDSDYESDTQLEIIECHAASDKVNQYMQNDLDSGDACYSCVRRRP